MGPARNGGQALLGERLIQKRPSSAQTHLLKALANARGLAATLSFNPRDIVRAWRGIPYFLKNAGEYRRLGGSDSFPLTIRDLWYRSHDRFSSAGELTFHYFYQDIWAARHLRDRGVCAHVDVGSRLDGFVAHALTFCTVTYVDLRPLALDLNGFEFRQGSITELPFSDDSVASLSSLHVIEHVGLGRYGDTVDPRGHTRAAAELSRVLQPGGTLLLATPVGRERLCFDAHRVFDPTTVLDMFRPLELVEFTLIDDRNRMAPDRSLESARSCEYGCGLFAFRKPCRDREPLLPVTSLP